MYLSPSLRREFLDKILINSYPEYADLLKEYKKIVTSRNKFLKSIAE
jgi:recombinational DNA repair ATPase RecF